MRQMVGKADPVQSPGCSITQVTPRRARDSPPHPGREAKRREAMAADKRRIAILEDRVQRLRHEVREWWVWFHQLHYVDRGQNGRLLDREGASSFNQQQQQQQQQPRADLGRPLQQENASLIDYSKWDDICTSESGEDDDEDYLWDESCEWHGEEEPQTEDEDANQDQENEAEDGDAAERHLDGENFVGHGDDEAGDADPKEAEEDEMKRDGFTSCGVHNRDLLLSRLSSAQTVIQNEFHEVKARLRQSAVTTTRIEEFQATIDKQIDAYMQMITIMDTGQFEQAGCIGIWHMVEEWQFDILSNLAAM